MTEHQDRADAVASLPFVGIHVVCVLALWTGVSVAAAVACAISYVVRMFGITAGYHRYFSHISFKTGRVFQFVLAWTGACAAQKGPLWWASHHRHHHAAADREDDVHSPLRRGFWWSHVGWILSRRYSETDITLVRSLARYRELQWIDRHCLVPPSLFAIGLFASGEALRRWAPASGANGPQLLVWGFFVSTVLLYHATFSVNSLAHVYGTRRFPTADGSRNNVWVALITLGEGWHNNHHFAPASERQGFLWWELDVTHVALVALSWVGLVWDLRRPPQRSASIRPLSTSPVCANRDKGAHL